MKNIVICTNCHRPTAKWISFRRKHASSKIIHANYLCSKCGRVTRKLTNDAEIAEDATQQRNTDGRQ